MRILNFEYFVNENYSLDEESKRTIDEYFNEIMEKPLIKSFFRGYFPATISFKGELFERLFTIYEDLMKSDEGKTILKNNLKTLLLIELRLDKMATNAIEKKTGKRDKKSERGNQTVRSGLQTRFNDDKYSLAMKIYPQEIESNLKNFKNIVDKMTTKTVYKFIFKGDKDMNDITVTFEKPNIVENTSRLKEHCDTFLDETDLKQGGVLYRSSVRDDEYDTYRYWFTTRTVQEFEDEIEGKGLVEGERKKYKILKVENNEVTLQFEEED